MRYTALQGGCSSIKVTLKDAPFDRYFTPIFINSLVLKRLQHQHFCDMSHFLANENEKGTIYWREQKTAKYCNCRGKHENWGDSCPLVYMVKEALLHGKFLYFHLFQHYSVTVVHCVNFIRFAVNFVHAPLFFPKCRKRCN